MRAAAAAVSHDNFARWKRTRQASAVIRSAARVRRGPERRNNIPLNTSVIPDLVFIYNSFIRFHTLSTGIGPEEHLKSINVPVIRHSPGVGENLMDHIAVGGLLFLIDYPVSLVMNRVVNIPTALRYKPINRFKARRVTVL